MDAIAPTPTVIPSRGWRGYPWGMLLVGSVYLLPLFAATYLSFHGTKFSLWGQVAAIAWFGGGYLAYVSFCFTMAPRQIELREDGLRAFYWYGRRLVEWPRLQPSRRQFSVWRGYVLNESVGDGTWRHYILTREQAVAVMNDERFVRRGEASPRVRASLGLP